jgi:hypothetical protein
MRDWLGTPVNLRRKDFLPFAKARALVHKLSLQNIGEWHAYSAGKNPYLGRRPEHIPSAPHLVYAKSGWQGYADWLGTNRKGIGRK